VLEGVYKRFARHAPWVLNGVDLVLERGTATFVTGTNGSGKSTLLRLVAGLTRPTRGTVKRVSTVSYLPERQPESLRMTGSAYLTHFGRMRGLEPVWASSRIRDVLDRLGLEPGPDVPIEDLSKGNRQKVLVAQAFLCPVSLIVLDEPFSGLDAPAQQAFRRLLADAREAGSAILMSGHDVRQSPDDYRTYEMVEGTAVERTLERADRGSSAPSAKVVVTLAGPIALDRQLLASIPRVAIEVANDSTNERRPDGVSAENPDDRRLTVAYVERTATDRFLVQAISAGWSVMSVSGTDNEDGDQVLR
jgi:ABC-type Mn2+/Zn2+ transport system ATPase subunit